MRKGKSVIGQDVLSHNDGEKVGSVKDLIIGPGNDSIIALLIDEGGLLSSARAVPMEQAVSFGKDAVMISDVRAVVPVDNFPAVDHAMSRDDKLDGKKVFTETGDEHGSVQDVYFDEYDGRVLGFEVSGGLIKNVQKGTSYLPLEDIVNIGPDVILIRPDAADALEAQVGGVQGKLQDVQGNMAQNAEQAAVGRKAGSTVHADNGGIIVATGQRITQAQIDEARAEGKMPELLAAAGMGQAQSGANQAGDALNQAGENIGEAASQAGDKAGDLWDQFTSKIQELTDSSGKRIDEAKTRKRLSDIQDAIGRPVTKVILDRQDNVVLDLGDIITHEAVQRAHDAGMLDSLLDNVYDGDVEFDKDEMRAQQEGEATVEKASGDAPMIDKMEQKLDKAEQEREQQKQQKQDEAEASRQKHRQEREVRAEERTNDTASTPATASSTSSASANAGKSTSLPESSPANAETIYVSNLEQSGSGAQSSRADTSGTAGKQGGTAPSDESLADEPTEEHVQADISDEAFHRGGKK